MEPDFSKYNLEELEECLKSIEHNKYPDRAAEIQEKLSVLYAEESERISRIPKQERQEMEKGSRKASIITLASGMILCSLYLYFGKISTRSGDSLLREDNPILFYMCVGVIAWLFAFYAFSIWEKRFKKERK